MRGSATDLPYVILLAHQGTETTEHHFSTMREAEGFIKRNTPLPAAVLSTTYDRPAADAGVTASHTESVMNDEGILARLKVIDERLRQLSAQNAAVRSPLESALDSPGH